MTTVAHWGTFEVANTGDLLFPLVLEQHLRGLVPDLTVRLCGPLGGTAPMGVGLPVERFASFSSSGFWEQARDVDAFVLGGGELGHPGSAVVRTPTGLQRIEFWPFVADLGLLSEIRPTAWNGIGVPVDIPDALAPVLRDALHHIDLLAVRDEESRARLLATGLDREVTVTPDTGVLVDRVFDATTRRHAVAALQERGALAAPSGRPLVVAHLSFMTPTVVAEAATALRRVRDAGRDLVLLALGPTHGDGTAMRELAAAIGGAVSVLDDPTLAEVAGVLELADAVAATSYHAVLIATVLGTPAAVLQHGAHRPSKQVSLLAQLGRERWLVDRPQHLPEIIDDLLLGLGPVDPEPVAGLQAAAGEHLDAVAAVVGRTRPAHDLSERSAAHRASLLRLEAATAEVAGLRTDLVLLQDQVTRAVERAHEVEAAFWRATDVSRSEAASGPLDLAVIRSATLESEPYRWGHVGPLFEAATARQLAEAFPDNDADDRTGDDGRRTWRYRVRSLVGMGAGSAFEPAGLAPVWRSLADVLASPDYRDAVSALTGVDLTDHLLEANAFAYPVGSFQDPHPDLPEKVVTHVMWFNETWQAEHGGCLQILRSRDPQDVARTLLPLLGWSAVFVRSEDSWHAVPPVIDGAPTDRRAVVATFHLPGARSSMWPT